MYLRQKGSGVCSFVLILLSLGLSKWIKHEVLYSQIQDGEFIEFTLFLQSITDRFFLKNHPIRKVQ